MKRTMIAVAALAVALGLAGSAQARQHHPHPPVAFHHQTRRGHGGSALGRFLGPMFRYAHHHR